MASCEKIDDCPVVKAVEQKFEGKLDTVTDSYEKTQEAIQESSQHLAEANIAFAKQAVILEGLGTSLKEYKSENEKAHDAFKKEDSRVHTRITGTQLELEKIRGSINTKIAEKVGALKAILAESKGTLKCMVDWKEIIKLTFLVTAISAFFKYILPRMGG